MPEYFEKYRDAEFAITEKLNGTSCTFYHQVNANGAVEYGVCGRNWELRETPTNSLWKEARRLKIFEHLQDSARSLAFQGELIGEGIQGNPYKIKGQCFYLFNIWDIEDQRYLLPAERCALINALNTLGCCIKHVPAFGWPGTILRLSEEKVLKNAEGIFMVNMMVSREGIVCKSNKLVDGQVVSFKVLSNKYLLSEK